MKTPDCGDMVVTKVGKIEGMITCVAKRFGAMQYEITYIADGKHYLDWFRRMEFEFKEENGVGFGK